MILRTKEQILNISPYVSGKADIEGFDKVIKLSANENPHGPSKKAVEAAAATLSEINRYADGDVKALREAIGKTHGIDPERIICGVGSDEIIYLLAYAFSDSGSEIIYTEHGFLLYPIAARAAGAVPVKVPEKNLRVDINEIIKGVTDKTRIVFIANPNNPTGTYISSEEMKALRRGLPEHVLLAIDSAYAEYTDAPDYGDGREVVDMGENTVMIRTFSKIYGLASLRLGWAYCPASIADILNRVRPPHNITGPTQAAGIAALADSDYLEFSRSHNRKWRRRLTDELTSLGLSVTPSEANFLLVKFPDGDKNASNAEEFISSKGIIVRKVRGYGLPEYLRLTIGTEEESLSLLAAVKAFLK